MQEEKTLCCRKPGSVLLHPGLRSMVPAPRRAEIPGHHSRSRSFFLFTYSLAHPAHTRILEQVLSFELEVNDPSRTLPTNNLSENNLPASRGEEERGISQRAIIWGEPLPQESDHRTLSWELVSVSPSQFDRKDGGLDRF